VLFVHGINGTPASFDYPSSAWTGRDFSLGLLTYPSGIHLGRTAGHLNQTMAK
jgi:hypothetical protein